MVKAYWANDEVVESPIATFITPRSKKGLVEAKEGLYQPSTCGITDEVRGDAKGDAQAYFDKYHRNPGNNHFYFRKGEIFVVQNIPWFFDGRVCASDYAQAEAYWDEVRRLTFRTEAGFKAKRLLMSFLNDRQKKELEKFGFFNHTLKWYPFEMAEKASGHPYKFTRKRFEGLFPRKQVYRFRFNYDECKISILKGSTNSFGAPLGKDHIFCLHPEEPYPAGDILLETLLMINNNVSEYLVRANW